MLRLLGLEILQKRFDLPIAEFVGERHEQIGTTQITVGFIGRR